MASLTLQQVACIYRTRRQQVRALHDFSLDVHDRELVVLVGPSGCGKTTVLRLIAGLEQPAGGIIRIDGRDVGAVAPKDRDVAMVFQDYALYPHMSVFQNMAFGLKMRGASSSQIADAVAAAARNLELTDVLERTPAQLSGGQKQRVALGRAIVRKPQVFLLDEPLSNLDTQLRAAARTQIKTLQRELSTTMIYVTHDQEEGMTLADRIAVMRGGILQQFAPPAEIYDRPANRFVAEFFGSPPMNLIPGALQSTGGKTFLQAEGLSIEMPSVPDFANLPPRIVLGIRPKDVEISAGPAPAPQWIASRIQSVEYLGDSMNLIVVLGNNVQLTAKSNTDRSWTPGQTVQLRFPPDRLHLFDAESGGRRLNLLG